jgi:hypothetical protein
MSVSRKEQALWLLEELVPGVGVNNIPAAFRAAGRLAPEALERTLAEVIRVQPALRTVFTGRDGTLSKTVLDEVDVGIEEFPSSEDRLPDALTAFAAKPFDLNGRPLLRAGLFHLERDDVFCVVAHHLIYDAVSAGILIAGMTGARPSEPVPPDPTGPQVRPEDVRFWREHLRGFDAGGLELRLGNPEPVRPTLTGGIVTHDLPATVRSAAKQLRAPEAVVLLAAYYLLLAGHGAGPDLVVGSPLNLRALNTPGAIGYHVNTMPLRVLVDPAETFSDLVRRTRDVYFASLKHSSTPVEELLPEMSRAGSSWRGSVFRHVFNYLPESDAEIVFEGTRLRPIPAEVGFSKHDLEFFVQSAPDGLRMRAVYYTEVLDHADVQAMVERYDELLRSVADLAERPVGQIPVWSAQDREVLRNRTGRFVAGPTGSELPVGVLGELCLAGSELPDGAGVAGQHPELGPYARTGVAARWRYDGTLEELGRLDRQVTVRGSRIQLERIESVLTSSPDVTAARVTLRPDENAPLVAFVQATAGPDLAERLRKLAAAELPSSVVPDEFVIVDVLPDTDECAAVPPPAGAVEADDLVEVLIGLWRELLDRTDVTARSNFFELGGHSLLAAKLAKLTSQHSGVRLRLADVFANPTPLTLARHLYDERPAG